MKTQRIFFLGLCLAAYSCVNYANLYLTTQSGDFSHYVENYSRIVEHRELVGFFGGPLFYSIIFKITDLIAVDVTIIFLGIGSLSAFLTFLLFYRTRPGVVYFFVGVLLLFYNPFVMKILFSQLRGSLAFSIFLLPILLRLPTTFKIPFYILSAAIHPVFLLFSISDILFSTKRYLRLSDGLVGCLAFLFSTLAFVGAFVYLNPDTGWNANKLMTVGMLICVFVALGNLKWWTETVFTSRYGIFALVSAFFLLELIIGDYQGSRVFSYFFLWSVLSLSSVTVHPSFIACLAAISIFMNYYYWWV